MLKVHLSVDDVFESLLDASSKNSIFENSFFDFLLRMHEKYSCKFSCYVFYKNGKENSLKDITDKFASELKRNESWLTFAYHADHPGKNDLERDFRLYEECYSELGRITGDSVPSTFVRLHYFIGSPECIEFLKLQGGGGIKDCCVQMMSGFHMASRRMGIKV